MAFQEIIASLTTQELKLTYQQLREMLRLAHVSVEDCANLLGITRQTIYKYVNDYRRVVPEEHIVKIIQIMQGVERYKRFFHEAHNMRIGGYVCAWQVQEGARISFDEHVVYGLYGVEDRFKELVASKDVKYDVLKTEGHVRLAFRLLNEDILVVQKKVIKSVASGVGSVSESQDNVVIEQPVLPAFRTMVTVEEEKHGEEDMA